MKRILHLTNDLAGSSVYKNLIANLDKFGIVQFVYTSVRSKELVRKNAVDLDVPHSTLIYSPILNHYTRINFYHKINKIFKEVQRSLEPSQYEAIHAHTWFSDGAVAYKLHKKYGIPYIITVRSTDINIFFKKLIYLRGLGANILLNAEKIIFLSESYKKRFYELKYFRSILEQLKSKIAVVPNGVDKFWVNNWSTRSDQPSDPVQILYAGSFHKRKNLEKLILAIEWLREKGRSIELQVIGSGGDSGKIRKRYGENEWIKFHGRIEIKSKIASIFERCDCFAMPSTGETFGLVYIEALSQGLPILYTKGEAVDGLYQNVGYGVEAGSIEDIKNGISYIIENYSKFDFSPEQIVSLHDWKKISLKYIDIYNEIIPH